MYLFYRHFLNGFINLLITKGRKKKIWLKNCSFGYNCTRKAFICNKVFSTPQLFVKGCITGNIGYTLDFGCHLEMQKLLQYHLVIPSISFSNSLNII